MVAVATVSVDVDTNGRGDTNGSYRSVRPSVKYVDDKNRKKIFGTLLTEVSGSAHDLTM